VAFYDAFVSYSHAKDKPIAAALQSVVQRLGKPWYRRRALRLFRDDTSLSATPHLWPTIEQALAQSRFLILFASPEAAASPWVNKEVAYWLDHNRDDTLLIAATGGELTWDNAAGDFGWSDTTPLPPVLKGRFSAEPKWVDLRSYREGADKGDAKFTELAADFAAAIHGTPKEDLLSQEVRQQRRALVLASTAAAGLLLLTIVATGAGVIAYQAQREAVAQRNRAERTLTAATETANSLVRDIAVRLRDVTGVPAALVKDILDRARKLQDELIGVGEIGMELRRSQSLALGESSVTLVTLGDANAALEAAKKGHAILQSLLSVQPENTEWQRAFASSKEKISGALMRLGRLEEAIALNRESLAILEALVSKEASNTLWQRELSIAFSNLSAALRAQGNENEALATLYRALAIREALVAKDQDNKTWQLDLASNYGAIGISLQTLGRLDEALALFRKYIALAQELIRKYPDSLSARESLWFGTMNTGSVFKDLGKFDEAVAAYRDALAVARAAVALDPENTHWQRSLLSSNESLADILVWLGKLDDALTAYSEAKTIANALVAKDAHNVEWRRDLGVNGAHIGDVLIKQNRSDEALTAYRESKAIFDDLAAKSPLDINWQGSRAYAAYRVGDALRAQKNYEAALAAYRECIAIDGAMAKQHPERLGFQADLSFCHARMGFALEGQGKVEEALNSYHEARSLYAAIIKKDPSNNARQRDLVITNERIGLALLTLHRMDESLVVYRECLSTLNTLLTRQPNNKLWQGDLHRIASKLGEQLSGLDRHEEALVSYRQSVAVQERLVRSAPSNAAQVDLAFDYMRLGVELETLGQLDEAIARYGDARAAFEQLIVLDSANLKWQRTLALTNTLIAHAYGLAQRPAEAAPYYQTGVTILEKLVAADPRNGEWLGSLSNSYLAYGEVQDALLRRDDAIDLYGKSLAAREKLLQLQNTPQVQLLIAEALVKLAIGNNPIGVLTRAVAIVRDLKAAGQLPGEQEGTVRNFEEKLAYRYAERARAHLSANRHAEAIADALTAVKTAPYDSYMALWLHVVRQRSGEDDGEEYAANAERLDQARWPYAVIAMFLGRLEPDDLVAAAKRADDEEARKGQLCEADFYLGLYQAEKGLTVAARRLFQSAIDRCPHDYTEYMVAQQELQRLDRLAGDPK
jgi:tetratricopeptide (TPR) repeat protein